MHLLYIAVATLLSCELLLRLPFQDCFQRIFLNIGKAGSVLRSRRISDKWKEKVLPVYAFRISSNSLIAFLLMLVTASPILLSGLFMDGKFTTLTALMLRFDVIIGITVLATGHLWIRKRFSKCQTTP